MSRLVAGILAAVATDLHLETDGQLGEPVPKMEYVTIWSRQPQGKTKNVETIYDRVVNGLGEEHRIDPKAVEIASRARKDFEKMKGELEERLRSELATTIPAEGLKACRTMLDIIDGTFEIFLCDVARADGPIKAGEAQILNILLGRAHDAERLNAIASTSIIS